MEFDFRDISIPGDILEDERISDGAKIIYGKIARLSYKTGFCWASNKFLDGTETGRSASRQIQELVNAGYVGSRLDEQKKRLLYICEKDSKIKKAPNIETPRETSPQAMKPEQENTLPDDKLIASKEDGITVWNRARVFWNEKELKPECRDIMMRAGDTSDVLRTMQNYTWAEIQNAIGNYAWHKKQPASEYSDPPPYGSLAGFLKTGVERYFDDNAVDQQFKKGG